MVGLLDEIDGGRAAIVENQQGVVELQSVWRQGLLRKMTAA